MRLATVILAGVSLTIGTGCVSSRPYGPLPDSTARYLDQLAVTHAEKGDLVSARYVYDTLSQVEEKPAGARTASETIDRTVENRVAAYLKKAADLEKDNPEAAIGFYLKAFELKPSDPLFRDRIYELSRKTGEYLYVTLTPDMDAASVSKSLYGTEDHADLVQLLITGGGDTVVTAGRRIRFPKTVPMPTLEQSSAAARLAKARVAYEESAYAEAVSLLDTLREEMTGNDEVDILYRQVRYAWAVSLLDRKDYAGALAQLEPITESHPPARSLSDQIRLQQVSRRWMSVKQHVDELDQKKQFADAMDQVFGFIKSAPHFAAALVRLNELRQSYAAELLSQGRLLDARRMVQEILPPTAGSRALLSRIQDLIHETAEDHYRRGVDLYVRERLEAAITEWETVLELVPDHEKALQDLVRARILLDKLRQID